MSYATTIAAIRDHAAASAAALANPITDVKVAYPAPPGRCVRIFYGGEVAPEVIGAESTLNSQLVGSLTVVMLFEPLSSLSENQAAVIEAECQSFVHAMRTAIDGDFTIGGGETVATVGYAEPGFASLEGVPFRTVEIQIVSEFTEYTYSP